MPLCSQLNKACYVTYFKVNEAKGKSEKHPDCGIFSLELQTGVTHILQFCFYMVNLKEWLLNFEDCRGKDMKMRLLVLKKC